jgi:hypothetical protein
MKKYVRVLTEATIDNPDNAPLFFDLVIDGEGKIIGEHLILAYQCFPKDRAARSNPFVVDMNGRVDFGIGYEKGSDQYGDIDIREKRITPGTIVRMWVHWI